jgi:hypothetical protein
VTEDDRKFIEEYEKYFRMIDVEIQEIRSQNMLLQNQINDNRDTVEKFN